MVFKNREEAAILLARALREYAGKKNAVILAIPRGGVVIGHYVSKDLKIPLGTIITKKIPLPENDEVAIGAVGLDVAYVDKKIAATYGIPEEYIEEKIMEVRNAVKERQELYRNGAPLPKLGNKTAIIIDDGVATGHTIFAAIKSVKKQKPKKIVVAIPVAPPETVKQLKKMADEVICLQMPDNFMAIGQFYSEFEQVGDEQAIEFLRTSYGFKGTKNHNAGKAAKASKATKRKK